MARKRPKFTEKIFKSHVTAIGQFALSWNALHEELAMIFWILMGYEHRPILLWNSSIYDRPRREMLKATVNSVPHSQRLKHPKLVEEILWLIKKTDSLENSRNNVIHSPLTHLKPNALAIASGIKTGVVPDQIFGNARAANLKEKDLIIEFRWCRDAAIVLRDYAVSIQETLMTAEPLTWPRRPSLPNRGHKKIRPAAQRPAHPK